MKFLPAKHCKQILPKILLANVQSLWSKLDELQLILKVSSPDVVCLTETWLTNEIDDDLIKINGYICTKGDRTIKRGGGTAIYIRNGIPYKSQNITDDLENNAEGILMVLPKMKLTILCIYIPPNLTAAQLASILLSGRSSDNQLWK